MGWGGEGRSEPQTGSVRSQLCPSRLIPRFAWRDGPSAAEGPRGGAGAIAAIAAVASRSRSNCPRHGPRQPAKNRAALLERAAGITPSAMQSRGRKSEGGHQGVRSECRKGGQREAKGRPKGGL